VTLADATSADPTSAGAAVARYLRDGFLLVPGLFSGVELDRLRAAADRVMDEAIAYGQTLDERGLLDLQQPHGFYETQDFDERQFLYGLDAAGRRIWRRAEGMLRRDHAFLLAAAHPRLLDLVRAVKGAADVVPGNDSMVVKMPGAGAAVPWHRDPPGERALAEGRQAAQDFTCDIYLDASTVENGCLWAVPGSHLGGPVPNDPLGFPVSGAVPLEAQPGDVLLHSTGVMHGSPTNRSSALRRTFYLHYATPAELLGGWWSWTPERLAARTSLLAQGAIARTGSAGYDR
jgi:phytanoyl-CoA hydroxylase